MAAGEGRGIGRGGLLRLVLPGREVGWGLAAALGVIVVGVGEILLYLSKELNGQWSSGVCVGGGGGGMQAYLLQQQRVLLLLHAPHAAPPIKTRHISL